MSGRIWNESENILHNSRDIWTLVDKFYKYTIVVKFETNLKIYRAMIVLERKYLCIGFTSDANVLGEFKIMETISRRVL